MKNKKLFITLSIMLVVLSGSAIAAWILNASTGATGFVTSDGLNILTFEYSNQDFGTIDTSNGEIQTNVTDYLFNSNGDLNMTVNFETIIIDVEDSCNNTGDLSFDLKIDSISYIDGQSLIIGSGNHSVITSVYSASHSCPQNFTTSVVLMEN